MSGLNGRRILLGGLVAGVVMAVIELGAEVAVGAEWTARLQALGLPEPGEGVMLVVLPSALVLGTLAVWLYALASSRLGAKVETACMMGAALWVPACLIPNAMLAAVGIMDTKLFFVYSVIGLVQLPAAAVAGSLLYRENAPSAIRGSVGRAA